MKKQRSDVRSTRTWSWSGEGTISRLGTVNTWSGEVDVRFLTGERRRKCRTVRVLVKVTEVKS